MLELNEKQLEAIKNLRNGSILWGGVGSGKSRTALGYYFFRVAKGQLPINGQGITKSMIFPKDVYIITTAKKRDSLEWEYEASLFLLSTDAKSSFDGVKVTVDSWNNISKYKDITNAFFIFDEQRVVGYGSWALNFIKISRSNQWILLTATPGDTWLDYIPVFIANGFYKNKTEFMDRHVAYSRFSKFPRVERYFEEKKLEFLKNSITVELVSIKHTERIVIPIITHYDLNTYKLVYKNRWDPYNSEPIKEISTMTYLLRRVVNSDPSRIEQLDKIFHEKKKIIVFYNFTYELKMIRDLCDDHGYLYSEWNGEKHQDLPVGDKWLYLVQYAAGSEAWNCIETNTIVFFSQNYSYKITEQASGRIDRTNTPFKKLYYYVMRSNSSIDLAIHRALLRKKNFNEKRFLSKF